MCCSGLIGPCSPQADGMLFIVMDYADGGDLCQMINDAKDKGMPLSERKVLDVFAQIVSGASAAVFSFSPRKCCVDSFFGQVWHMCTRRTYCIETSKQQTYC